MRLRMRGFSLIEMLVVLVLMGLVAGVAFPRMESMYRSYQLAAVKDHIKVQLVGLAQSARWSGKPLSIAAGELLNEPHYTALDEERIIVLETLTLHGNGFCTGGRINVLLGLSAFELTVLPPYCQVN